MKQLFLILLLCVILLTLASCGASDDSVIPSDAIVSPNGKYAISSNVQKDIKDNDGKSYSIYEVKLFDKEDNILICTFPIIGDNFSFLWASNNRYVVAIYSGTTWTDYSVLDVLSHTQSDGVKMPQIIEGLSNIGEVFSYVLDSGRPDPQIYPLEWSPDNKKLLIAYKWTDTEGNRQSGIFVYSLFEGIYSNLMQYQPSENYHIDIQKPDNFKW